jgi:hypothetical protein
MQRYSQELKNEIRRLRSLGKTYSEIKKQLKINIPKSSLSYVCEGVKLPREYAEIIRELNYKSLGKGRAIAAASNRLKKINLLEEINKRNKPISDKINDPSTAKIALSMLCLGEASKSGNGSSFYLGNSDPKIVILFLHLLKICTVFEVSKVRCTVQCRADQDVEALENYCQQVTMIPKKQFYKTRIDPRTVGKPTLKRDYKGVLKVDYFDRRVQLDLESLADLVYNNVV